MNETQYNGNNAGRAQASYSRQAVRRCIIDSADYRKLRDVCLATKPSQHETFHMVAHYLEIPVLIYVLIEFLPLAIPVLLEVEGASDIEYTPGMFPGLSAVIIFTIICGLIQRKIRYDVFHSLPAGFDYWGIKRVLHWQVFGPGSLKVSALRFLHKTDQNYPELGYGIDDEGNYHAFVVPGKDAILYPYRPAPRH